MRISVLSTLAAMCLTAAACEEPLTGPDAQRAFSEARAHMREVPEGPLVFLDGEPLPPGQQLKDSRLDRVDPNDIVRIEILKGEAAARAYGDEGRRGVIRVYTTRGSVPH